jgi:hypothetical protein
MYDKEIYIVAGGYSYSVTLLNAGKVAVATRNYKIALLMPAGQASRRPPAHTEEKSRGTEKIFLCASASLCGPLL